MGDEITEGLAALLLQDMTRNKNIYWANEHGFFDEITPQEALEITPRYRKPREEKDGRRQGKAEVFTPPEIVGEMVSSIWDGGKSGLSDRWLEITCGEGAFITTRYHSQTGEAIPISERQGFLDRKLALCTAMSPSPAEWWNNALTALKSCYGYEYQGDSLFIARKNVLLSVREAWQERWGQDLNQEQVRAAAGVIRWNLWQMDGISECLPDPAYDIRKAKAAAKKGRAHLDRYSDKLGLIPARIVDWFGSEGSQEYRLVGRDGKAVQNTLLP